MKLSRLCLGLIVIGLCVQELWAEPPVWSAALVECAQRNNVFAVDLYGRLVQKDRNLIFSPLSVDTALAMTYAGARGETARQMAAVLHLSEHETNAQAELGVLLNSLSEVNNMNGQFSMVNAMWAQSDYPFLDSYKQFVQDTYHASLNQFTDANRHALHGEINDWVSGQTHGHIREILPPEFPGPSTRLLLVDAMYFKAPWMEQFNESRTTNAPFYTVTNESVTVPTMQTEGRFYYMESDNARILEMPFYADGSMMIFLPKKGRELPELWQTVAHMDQLYQSRKLKLVRVSLPKFRIESQFDLRGPLSAMGMGSAFSAMDADFSGMCKVRPFFVEAVLHKACIDVDEKGGEAAAATVVSMTDGVSEPATPIDFKVDHPFIFIILEPDSGAILFMGQVVNPLE
jgi:serpin B